MHQCINSVHNLYIIVTSILGVIGECDMAKPIRATPVLRGKDAIRFIEEMHRVETEPISEVDKETIKRLKKNTPFFESFFG